ncbi:hypothetical protein TNCV_2189841 [Trichonephila clavipes]|nr:hypothetical protein TNCV_2189841 [Trichonephila clavipes]
MESQLGVHGCVYPCHCISDRTVFNGVVNDKHKRTNGEKSFFQMNPDSVYSTKIVTSVFRGIYNLSPIENVWSMTAERLSRHHTSVTTVNELWHRVEAAWAFVPVHAIQSLFDSMPMRISAVITARGGCSGD